MVDIKLLKQIRPHRIRLKINLYELSQMAMVSPQIIENFEKGIYKKCQKGLLESVLKAMKFKFDPTIFNN